jgi:predicted RND superfamily exporter protein
VDISLARRQSLLDAMTADLHPPAGTHATFSGLAVVGVELVKALAANRQAMTFLLLGLVLAWPAVGFRNFWKVVVALVPVVFAVGGPRSSSICSASR